MRRRLLCITLILLTLGCNVVTRITPGPSPAPTIAPPATRPATRTPAIPPSPAPPATVTARPPVDHEWVRLFDQVWEDVWDYYVDPNYHGVDWAGLYDSYLARVQAAQSVEEVYGILRELIDRLGDDHSVFLSPDEAREDDQIAAGEVNYVGIGAVPDVLAEKRLAVILYVFPGSPAEQAGLRAHDSILAANGQPLVDGQGRPHFEELDGEPGTAVVLTVRSPGGAPRDVTVTRARITGQEPVVARRLEGDVGYLMISAFTDQTIGDRAAAALAGLTAHGPPLRGLIVDMRLNYGGYDTVLEQALGLFSSGTVGYFVDHGDQHPLEVTGHDVGGSQHVPLVVLVGHGTQSFGEIFSGILQDVRRAKLVGMTTTGNVEILLRHDYEDGSRLWLAEETFRPLHSQADWEVTGIVPDVTVNADWDEFTDEDDPQLQKALELLKENR